MNHNKFKNVRICDESTKNEKIEMYGIDYNIGDTKDIINQNKIISNSIKKYIRIIFYTTFASIFFCFGLLFQKYKSKNEEIPKKYKMIQNIIKSNESTKPNPKIFKINEIKNTTSNSSNNITELIMSKIFKFAKNKRMSEMEII